MSTRSLGLDIGDKWIGVALSDPMGILASPLTIVSRRDDEKDIETVLNIARQHQVGQIVAGLPRSMDGSLGKQAEKVREFTQKLADASQIPVALQDERLTTVAAKRLLHTAKPGKKVRDDAAAAALILQSYLDKERD